MDQNFLFDCVCSYLEDKGLPIDRFMLIQQDGKIKFHEWDYNIPQPKLSELGVYLEDAKRKRKREQIRERIMKLPVFSEQDKDHIENPKNGFIFINENTGKIEYYYNGWRTVS